MRSSGRRAPTSSIDSRTCRARHPISVGQVIDLCAVAWRAGFVDAMTHETAKSLLRDEGRDA